ncbi:MAG TPA: HAMP domain-containing sensor histidine kinase [Xanthobacteraceae bacterium]|nr:HAMP domain-containing sensor histidine kinase [Xanthobacteraceae bacterium]
MEPHLQSRPTSNEAPATAAATSGALDRLRALPIRWRVLSIATLNIAIAVVFTAIIWNGAQVLTTARSELRESREADRQLAVLESQAGRLQGLIHRYFTQPDGDVLQEITELRKSLLGTLQNRAFVDPTFAASAADVVQATERFVAGFDDLRNVQTAIMDTYENQVLSPAREMSGLYAIVEGATTDRSALVWPALSKSRESFSTTLVQTNVFYLQHEADTAKEVMRNLERIESTVPVMLDLADNDLQRGALRAIQARATAWRQGIAQLEKSFATRAHLLSDAVDGNQAAMAGMIERLSSSMRERERLAYDRFENTLGDLFAGIAIAVVLSVSISILVGLAIARSIVRPLQGLMSSVDAIVSGHYAQTVDDLNARDEIGDMARAVEVFRTNAIAKRQAEIDLKASKEHAEDALRDLQDAQRSLIEAEKFAALGGLVAGVAHEVNNPVGISLTVASSFARRCAQFSDEIRDGAVRRSKLEEFVAGNHEAAKQLVTNLNRAADLIQSFKQVAVDRSHAERRVFNLREATEQMMVSLRPALKHSLIWLSVDVPAEISLKSYPGPYGQVLTNLVLNALSHAFPDKRAGTLRLSARKVGIDQVEIEFADDGIGMSEEVQRRAFEPFFTTRRNRGGTGLGLHIVYNLVSRRLGGTLRLESQPGHGTVFRIRLPLAAPKDDYVDTTLTLAELE